MKIRGRCLVFCGFGGVYVWGLVPTAVGVAYLIYYLVERRKPVHPREESP